MDDLCGMPIDIDHAEATFDDKVKISVDISRSLAEHNPAHQHDPFCISSEQSSVHENDVRLSAPTGRPSTQSKENSRRIQQSQNPDTQTTAQKVPCPICGAEHSRKTLKRHVRSKHEAPAHSFKCEFCKRTFARLDIKERHRQEKHADESGLAECTYCGKKVVKRALKTHFASKKCHASKAASEHRENGPVPGRDVFKSERLLSLDAVSDALTICTSLCVRLWSLATFYEEQRPPPAAAKAILRPYPMVRSTYSLPIEVMAGVFEFRDFASRVLRNEIQSQKGQFRVLNAIRCMQDTDECLFGRDSEIVAAHDRYILSTEWEDPPSQYYYKMAEAVVAISKSMYCRRLSDKTWATESKALYLRYIEQRACELWSYEKEGNVCADAH